MDARCGYGPGFGGYPIALKVNVVGRHDARDREMAVAEVGHGRATVLIVGRRVVVFPVLDLFMALAMGQVPVMEQVLDTLLDLRESWQQQDHQQHGHELLQEGRQTH